MHHLNWLFYKIDFRSKNHFMHFGYSRTICSAFLFLINALAMSFFVIIISACTDKVDNQSAYTASSTSAPASTPASASHFTSDNQLESNIKAELSLETSLHGYEIYVSARQGSVQISGLVENQLQHDKALSIARSVNGVDSIEDKLRIKN